MDTKGKSKSKSIGFKFFTGDINYLSYGGTWARRISTTRFHFIELTNMDDACGSDNEGHPTYVVELAEVDISEVSENNLLSALRSSGVTWDMLKTAKSNGYSIEGEIAYACFSYGIKSPLHDVSTNNAQKGIAECRKESYLLTSDPDAYEERMETPVNRIGSTAREFGRGDLDSALLRGLASGDESARIIAKMYVASDGHTLGGERMDEEVLQTLREAVSGEV